MIKLSEIEARQQSFVADTLATARDYPNTLVIVSRKVNDKGRRSVNICSIGDNYHPWLVVQDDSEHLERDE